MIYCYDFYVVLFSCGYGCGFAFRFEFVGIGCCAFGWVAGFAVLWLEWLFELCSVSVFGLIYDLWCCGSGGLGLSGLVVEFDFSGLV